MQEHIWGLQMVWKNHLHLKQKIHLTKGISKQLFNYIQTIASK